VEGEMKNLFIGSVMIFSLLFAVCGCSKKTVIADILRKIWYNNTKEQA